MTLASPIIHDLCKSFIERSEALGYKGKKRDDMCMEYFIGAAIGAALAENTKCSTLIQRVAVYLLSPRGYRYCEEVVQEYKEAIDKVF